MNQSDPNAKLEKVLTKIADNVAAIQSRLTSLENSAVSKIGIIQLRNDLRKIETKMATIDGHVLLVEENLSQGITSTNANVTKVAKKLDKKFIELFDFLDGDIMKQSRKLKEIEQHLGLAAS